MCVYFLPCILHKMLTVSHLHQVSSSVQVTRTPTSQTCSLTEECRTQMKKKIESRCMQKHALTNARLNHEDITELWCCMFWFMQLNFSLSYEYLCFI